MAESRLTQHALHVVHQARREAQLLRLIDDLLLRLAARHDELRQIAHNLARWRHLRNVTQHAVGSGVRHLDVVPRLGEAKARGLELEVGVLAAGHLVNVDIRGARLDAGLEG